MVHRSALLFLVFILGAICCFAFPINHYQQPYSVEGYNNGLASEPRNSYAPAMKRRMIRDDKLWGRDLGERMVLQERDILSSVQPNKGVPSPGTQNLDRRSKAGNFFKKIGNGLKNGFKKVGGWLKDNWQTVLGVATKFI